MKRKKHYTTVFIYKLQKQKQKQKQNKKNKDKEILKEAGKKKMYRGTRIRIILHFSSKTIKARLEWNEIFVLLKEEND